MSTEDNRLLQDQEIELLECIYDADDLSVHRSDPPSCRVNRVDVVIMRSCDTAVILTPSERRAGALPSTLKASQRESAVWAVPGAGAIPSATGSTNQAAPSSSPPVPVGYLVTKPLQATISFTVPIEYPEEPLREWLLIGNQLTKDDIRCVIGAVKDLILAMGAEGGSLMQAAIETARNTLQELKQDEAEEVLAAAVRKVERAKGASGAGNDGDEDDVDDETQLLLFQHRSLDTKVLGRRCIYFHHILSSYKRCFIQNAARRLDLKGFCKVGYPGILIIEGCEEACEVYVQLLQRLRWKLMVVRGEERVEAPDGFQALRNIIPFNLQSLFATQAGRGTKDGRDKGATTDAAALASAELSLTSRPVWETDTSEEIAKWCNMCDLSVLFRTVMKIYC